MAKKGPALFSGGRVCMLSFASAAFGGNRLSLKMRDPARLEWYRAAAPA